MRYLLTILLMVYSGNAITQNTIKSYEYWFDNKEATPTKITIPPTVTFNLVTDIPITDLLDGLHGIHLRFKDDSAQYSEIVSQFFYIYATPQFNSKQITGYQFWFDGNDATGIVQNVPAAQAWSIIEAIDIAALSEGIHTFSIRFKDDEGEWSGTVSQFFYKYTIPQFTSKQITGYQYWFDGNDASAIVQNVPAKQEWLYMENIDITALSEGIHTFSIRFKDDEGEWSGAVSQFFYKYTPPQMSSQKITGYQYWFDADYTERHTISIIPTTSFLLSDSLSLAALKDGLHTISIRCKDDAAQWSTSISQFFYIEKKDTIHTNQVSAYRYWFDDMDSTLNLVDLVPFINPFVMNTYIPVDGIDSGKHVIHFQFRDANGVWSMVTTDSTSTNTKTIYTFNGNGNWSSTANWVNNTRPPLILSGSYQIFIDPLPGGQCILDVSQQLTTGAIITVSAGKSFIVPGNLNINQ